MYIDLQINTDTHKCKEFYKRDLIRCANTITDQIWLSIVYVYLEYVWGIDYLYFLLICLIFVKLIIAIIYLLIRGHWNNNNVMCQRCIEVRRRDEAAVASTAHKYWLTCL